MSLGFDIFKKLDDGSPLWVMQAATLPEAKRHLDSLVLTGPGQFFIRDASTGEVLSDPGLIASD
jgi:hypothetical protein